ncbi:MAG: amidase [Rhodospirillales bacterium]
MDLSELADLDALSARDMIRDGEINPIELTEACLARIDEHEDAVRAWTYLDPDHALAQAQALYEAQQTGAPLGPLHGIPIGIKDIFDTFDMPAENGSVLYRGRMPDRDSTAVAKLREAGAIILGKTVTTEFATHFPGKTRNPHNPAHTPGGSSSGSAAAVACSMVPLAIGTQTNGSVIRPASYCGTVGFKPTYGGISRAGVFKLSHILDHVGVFARTVGDAALIAEALMGYDPRDTATRMTAKPALIDTAREDPPLEPRLAFVKSPVWDLADADVHDAFAELVYVLGDAAREEELPAPFDTVVDWHRWIMNADLAQNLAREYAEGRDKLSAMLIERIEDGLTVRAVDYNRARDWIAVLNDGLDVLFENYDAILTPATTGEAPAGLENTGDPVFSTIWTFCGLPAITLPIFEGAHGLPIGAQLVGPRGNDARLLRTANWLANRLAS